MMDRKNVDNENLFPLQSELAVAEAGGNFRIQQQNK